MYRFEEKWALTVPVDVVWQEMLQVEAWPRWWDGLEFADSRDGLPVGVTGKRYSTRWKGSLPYGLDIQAVIRKVRPCALITADISGDIEGHCACRIETSRRGTRGVFSLHVRTTRLWMCLLTPFFKGYFTENHKRLMAQGLRGFSRYLAKGDR